MDTHIQTEPQLKDMAEEWGIPFTNGDTNEDITRAVLRR